MKKIIFTLLFCSLLIFSFIFASCNSGQDLPDQTDPSQQSAPVIPNSSYEAMIRELENQIIELQQSQYISDAENQKELTRLQNLLAELKNQMPSDTQQQKPEDSTPSDSSSPDETPSSALFSYTRSGDTAAITGYSGEDERLVIPTMIDGYAVTEIADSAFSSDKIKSVVVPEGVVRIGWFAFAECKNLESVTLPKSVTAIGYSAFPTKLSPVTIYCHPDSFAQKYAQSYGLSWVNI